MRARTKKHRGSEFAFKIATTGYTPVKGIADLYIEPTANTYITLDSISECRYEGVRLQEIYTWTVHEIKSNKNKISGLTMITAFRKKYSLAYCMASTYLPNPTNSKRLRWIDGNKENNRLDNLEWRVK